MSYGEYIGQHNNGNHNTLYHDVNDNLGDSSDCGSGASRPQSRP